MLATPDAVHQAPLSTDESRTLKRLQALYRATALAHRPVEEQLQALLRAGIDMLDMEIGIISRIEGQTCTVLHVASPTGAPHAGQQFPLSQTYCELTVALGDVLHFADVQQTAYRDHPCFNLLHLYAYIAVPLMVAGKPFGTLQFASTRPHDREFDEADRDFFRLVGMWVSAALERQQKDEALRASEARWRSLVSNSPDIIKHVRRDFSFDFMHLPTTMQNALKGIDLPRFSFWDLILQDDHEIARQAINATFETGQPQEYEHRGINPTVQGAVWYFCRTTPIMEQGEVVYVQVVSSDITARKLVESENARLFETSLDLLGTINGPYFIRLNSAWERTLGYTQDELYALPYLDLIHPDDAARVRANAVLLGSGQTVRGCQCRLRAKDGEYHWFSWDMVPDSETGHTHISGRNITADKLLEDQFDMQHMALLESEARFRQMAETIEDCFWMFDPAADTMLYVSPAYEHITGYPPDLLYADSGAHLRLLIPSDQERLRETFNTPFLAYDERYRIQRADGQITWVWESAFTVTDEAGQPYRVVGILRDVNLEKQAELHIQEQNETLQATNRDLEAARVQAEAASRLKSSFLATMSHELRTPLNAIIGYTELQQAGMAGPLSADQEQYLERTLVNANDLLRLINEVLDLSKIEAGRMELVNQPFPPAALLQGIVNQHQVLAGAKQIALSLEGAEALPSQLIGDCNRIKQLVVNLLANAIKFTERGYVQVETRREGACWQIIVSDSGIGIPPELQATIFDEFRQVDGGLARQHGGSGLGLAIVKKFVTLMHGTIDVESAVGVGSRFRLGLPLPTPPAEA